MFGSGQSAAGPAGQQMDVFVTDVLLQAWSAEGKTLEHVAAYTPNSYTVRSIDTVERIQGMRVSPSMFALLRTTPQLGRLFLPDEAAPGASPVVLLSDRLWRSRFGADPGVIGEALTLETRPHTIVGVLPADFYFPDRETLLLDPTQSDAADASWWGAWPSCLCRRWREYALT